GGAGRDKIYGEGGSDVLYIENASDVVAGEIYDGGAGGDELGGPDVTSAVDLTGTTLVGLEGISGFGHGLALTAAQLDAFTGVVRTGTITLASAGTVDISDAGVSTNIFNLSDLGNNLTLSGGGISFSHTVNGGSAADTVTIIGGAAG